MKNTRTENCIFILLAFLLIIIPVGIYYDLNLNNQLICVAETPIETVKYNKCIFNLFTELFKVTNSSCVYYPSHFSSINIRNVQHLESSSMLDYIRQEQYVMLKDLIKVVFNNLDVSHKLSN